MPVLDDDARSDLRGMSGVAVAAGDDGDGDGELELRQKSKSETVRQTPRARNAHACGLLPDQFRCLLQVPHEMLQADSERLTQHAAGRRLQRREEGSAAVEEQHHALIPVEDWCWSRRGRSRCSDRIRRW
jgi:hypothetical protein